MYSCYFIFCYIKEIYIYIIINSFYKLKYIVLSYSYYSNFYEFEYENLLIKV